MLTPAVSARQQGLADVSQRRRQLIQTRTAELNRAEHYTDPLCLRQNRQFQKIPGPVPTGRDFQQAVRAL